MENPTSKLCKGKWTSKSVGCLCDKEEKGVGKACNVYLSGTSATSLCSFAKQSSLYWVGRFLPSQWA
eukprot:6154522-Amphidinium_carterae.1